jgi:hypothetical protein
MTSVEEWKEAVKTLENSDAEAQSDEEPLYQAHPSIGKAQAVGQGTHGTILLPTSDSETIEKIIRSTIGAFAA